MNSAMLAAREIPLEARAVSSSPERLSVETLFRDHARFVASFLRRLGAGEGDVDDLVQEVFLVAHKKGGFVPGEAKPQSWLAAIAVRLFQNRRRSFARRREDMGAPVAEPVPEGQATPARALEVKDALERVQKALDTLDVHHRATFLLYELEGESCQVISELLDVKIGTVYSRLHSARSKFLEAYESQAATPEPPRTVAQFVGDPS